MANNPLAEEKNQAKLNAGNESHDQYLAAANR